MIIIIVIIIIIILSLTFACPHVIVLGPIM
jgi:hypothetical protein